jgi:hypothetical protein
MGNIKSNQNVTATHTTFDIERIVVLRRDVLVWPLLTRIGCSPVLCTARQPRIFRVENWQIFGFAYERGRQPSVFFWVGEDAWQDNK